MAEQVFITIDSSIKEKKGVQKIDIDDFASGDVDDSQDVYFTDGHNITGIEIAKMGKDDGSPDTFHFDLSNFNDDFTVEIKSEGPEDSFVIENANSYTVSNGVYTITYIGSDSQEHTVEIDPGDANVVVNTICFTPGTLIDTPRGEVPVETLEAGDLVFTVDHGYQPLRWIGHRTVLFNGGPHKLNPILFPRGCLGNGLPVSDLMVSPQHRMLLGGEHVKTLFDEAEVLALAKGLVGRNGIRHMRGKREARYITLLLDRHEILVANGAPTESFRPGGYALSSLSSSARGEILGLFPELLQGDIDEIYPAARRILKYREVRTLVERDALVTESIRTDNCWSSALHLSG